MDAKKVFHPPFHYTSTTTDYFLSRDSWTSMCTVSRETSFLSTHAKSLSGKITECFGFLGILELQSSYIITISEAKFIANLHNVYIFLISDVEFLPLTSAKDLPALAQLKNYLTSTYFYFSYNLDLTNSFSRIFQNPEPECFGQCDPRFYWNAHLTKDFNTEGAKELIIPIVSGFIQIEQVVVEGVSFDFGLISRRAFGRSGPRFHTRGVNSEGEAANFVETEQIIGWNDNGKYILHSFLQVRGSIPLIWTQKPNLSYNPPVKINQDLKDPGLTHLKQMANIYKEVCFINLVDKKGSQKRLGEAFNTLIEEFKGKYVWFDFHAECKGMKFENLANLIDQVSEEFERFEWSESVIQDDREIRNGNVKRIQSGVFRTNCVDCLDRTNVAQSMFARAALSKQIVPVVKKNSSDPLAPFPSRLEGCFREFWTNNANVLSILYSGTPAMKTDFTKTGKRSWKGVLQDFTYGFRRYFINNFMDGENKNVNDLFLGYLPPSRTRKSSKNLNLFTFIALVLIIILACCVLSAKLSKGLMFYPFFAVFMILFYKLLILFGSKLVDHPQIIK